MILAKPATDLVIDLLGPDRGLKRLSVTPIDSDSLEHPPIVHADDPLMEARRVLGEAPRAAVLDQDGRFLGELDREMVGSGDGRVRERIRPADATIPADRTLYDAFSQMLIHKAAWVAVVDNERFVGVLTPASFLHAIRKVPAEVDGTRP